MRILATGCLLFAVAFGLVWAAMLRKQSTWKSWPQAVGRIVSSHPELRHATPTGKRLLRAQWELQVSYQYAVAGREYEGRNLSNEWLTVPVSASQEIPEFIRDLRDRYVAGATVAVHYDPGAPQRSFLISSPVSGLGILAGLTILFSASAALLYMAARKMSN